MILLGKVFHILLDFFIPEEARVKNLLKLPLSSLRKVLPRAERPTDRLTYSLFDYRNKDVRAFIWGIKYKCHPELLAKAAELIYEEILETISDEMIFKNKTRIALVPIPMHPRDERVRGYNQSYELARAIETYAQTQKKSEIFLAPILRKVKQTKHQRNLERGERLKNISHTFVLHDSLSSHTLPLLIDDVTTTGATLEEARRAFGAAGFQTIRAITLAH